MFSCFRILAETRELPAQVEKMYLTVYSRKPNAEEVALSVQALQELQKQWDFHKQGLPENERPAFDAELKALTIYGHTLLNSAGFLYVD